eukprot:1133110-Rhodomonas_salina.2
MEGVGSASAGRRARGLRAEGGEGKGVRGRQLGVVPREATRLLLPGVVCVPARGRVVCVVCVWLSAARRTRCGGAGAGVCGDAAGERHAQDSRHVQ